jgi:energy-converting hydrogenase B subunit D
MLFWVMDFLCLSMVLAAGVLVVVLRNLNGAVMALSALGTVLTLLFVVLGAPDVAHSEIVVGAIALPALYLIAIGKTRTVVSDEPELSEPASEPTSGPASGPVSGAGERGDG